MQSVDIILATYNGEKFLSEQIDSLLNQNHLKCRIIMRDDNSSDGTLKILKTYAKKYPKKIVLIPSFERLGILANFSTLISHSDADYTLFSDQDDIWDEDKVTLSLQAIKKLETVYTTDCPILVHSDLQVINEDGAVISPSFWHYTGLKPSIGQSLNRLLMQNVVTGCAMMINRSLRELSVSIPKGAVMHDWWLALVATAFGKIGCIEKATIKYRQHGKNALGAKKLYSIEYIRRGIQRLNKNDPQREYQAKELLKRYSHNLSKNQKNIIEAYLKLPKEHYFKRIYMIFKYSFFRMGLLRNFIGILLKAC